MPVDGGREPFDAPDEQKNVLSRDVVSAMSRLRTDVGVTGFEPAASSSRTKRATKLRHTPWQSHTTHTGGDTRG